MHIILSINSFPLLMSSPSLPYHTTRKAYTHTGRTPFLFRYALHPHFINTIIITSILYSASPALFAVKRTETADTSEFVPNGHLPVLIFSFVSVIVIHGRDIFAPRSPVFYTSFLT
ncbi:hypothetical protein M408DRAFT_97409 [Serendipita vermifera MAFF 305830]|uniref:Uncharacterized protein n=1 Tax=Serendipita vermifera MAFF 305830 TaxID=933852 RepID=A0A0C2X911_SERVB|nr:hypothetical protein M408DRAFT_97409 [Serendipita vermifera MAFF 305830]